MGENKRSGTPTFRALFVFVLVANLWFLLLIEIGEETLFFKTKKKNIPQSFIDHTQSFK
jgi:hypothetical protein